MKLSFKSRSALLTGAIAAIAQPASAGMGWYVTIKNSNPDQAVVISYAGSDCFYEGDFGTQQVVEPSTQRRFYFEEKNALFENCTANTYKVLGVDVASSKGREHIEFVQTFTPVYIDLVAPIRNDMPTSRHGFQILRPSGKQVLQLTKELNVEATLEFD